MRRSLPIVALLALAACGGGTADVPGEPEGPRPPELDTSEMEPLVREMLDERRARVVERPLDAKAWTALGLALDAHFFLEEAEQCLAIAMDLDATEFEATYDHAVLGTLLPRDAAEVTARFERAAAMRPDYAPVFARLGNHLLSNGDPAAAEDAFRRALEVFDQYDYARLGLARALLDQDDVAGAIELLEPLHEKAPGDPGVATALGQALALDGRVDDAAAVTERQRSAPPGKLQLMDSLRGEIMTMSRSAAMNFQRGETKLRRGDLAGAAIEFERVLTVDADNRLARAYLARTLMNLGRGGEARPLLEEMLGASARDPDAHVMLGQIEAETGRFEPAVAHFETASRAGQLDDISYRAWVTSLGSLERWEEALYRLDEWGEQSPANPERAYMRVMALFNAGRKDEARVELETAIAAHPNSPLRAQASRILDG